MFDKLVKNKVDKMLSKIVYGSILVSTPENENKYYKGQRPGLHVDIKLKDWRVVVNLLLKGDIGFAADYSQGYFSTSNLSELLQFALDNDRFFNSNARGKWVFRKFYSLLYLTRRNTIRGSQKNIMQHYDLGNDFYSLWLDDTMTYSSGIFLNNNDNLPLSQNNKYDRILDKIAKTEAKILEIGCGWGGLIKRSIDRGLKHSFRGLTLSREQAKVAKSKLDPNVAEILIKDYRKESDVFDYIVSIEMLEAVGKKYWPHYFKKIKQLLNKNGKFILQTITIDDRLFKRYAKNSDMIRTFIFPGGLLPNEKSIYKQLENRGLLCNEIYRFGQDYAKTLKIWLNNLLRNKDKIIKLGFDNNFIRMWEFYLAECIAGFTHGRINVVQMEIMHAK